VLHPTARLSVAAGKPADGRKSATVNSSSASSSTSSSSSSSSSASLSALPATGQHETSDATHGTPAPSVLIATNGDRYEPSYGKVYHVQRTCSTKPKDRSLWIHRCCVRWAAASGAPLSGGKEERGRFLWSLQESFKRKKCAKCGEGGASLSCQSGHMAAAAAGGDAATVACKVRYHLPCLMELWTAGQGSGAGVAAPASSSSHSGLVIQSLRDNELSFLCPQHGRTGTPSSLLSPASKASQSSAVSTASPPSSAANPRPVAVSNPEDDSTPRSAHDATSPVPPATAESAAVGGTSSIAGEEDEDDDDDCESLLTAAATQDGSGNSLRLSQYVQSALSLFASLHGTVSRHRLGHFSSESYFEHISSCQQRFGQRLRCVKVVLCGRNGVGKTFLLNILCFLTCESEQEYRQRWLDTELRVSQLEAYWDQEADVVCADLLRVCQESTVSPRQRAATATAADHPAALSLAGSQRSGGGVPSALLSAPTSAPLLSDRSASTSLWTPASGASSSSSSHASVRGAHAKSLPELPDLWEGDRELSSWSRASWLQADAAAAAGTTGLSDEDDRRDRRQPSQLGSSGCSCVVVELSQAGSRQLTEKKAEDMSKWEEPLLNATWKPLNGQALEPWLLQSVENGGVTTSHIYRLKHGKAWHACLRYVDRPVAQQLAFRYVQLMMDRWLEGLQTVEDDELEYARLRYSTLLGLPLSDFDWSSHAARHSSIDRMLRADDGMNSRAGVETGGVGPAARGSRPLPVRASEMPLLPSITEWLNRSVLIRGEGRDMQVDRMFVRAQLRFLCCVHPARFALLLSSVYGPCGILEEVEVWDTPGTEDTNAINGQLLEHALDKADVPLVLLEREAKANKTLLRQLMDMQVIDRCAMRPQALGHIAFLHSFERSERTQFSDLANIRQQGSSTASAHKPIDQRDASVLHDTKAELRRLLHSRAHRAGEPGAQRFNSAHVQQMMEERMTFLCIYPTLFASLLMQERATSHPHLRWADLGPESALGNSSTRKPDAAVTVDERTISEVLGRTRGYELFGLIRHCIPRICQQALQQLIGAQQSHRPALPVGSAAASSADMYDADSSSSSSSDDEDDEDERDDHGDDDDTKREAETKDTTDGKRRAERRGGAAGAEAEDMDDEEGAEEKATEGASASSSRRSPLAAPYPGSGTESDEEEEAVDGFTAGSFLSSLVFQINKFAAHHAAVSPDSQRRYEQIRETARGYAEQMTSGRRDAESLIQANLVSDAQKLQKVCRQLLEKALDVYEFDYLATERVVAVQEAAAQWASATAQDNLTVAHIDPRYRGLGQPIQLRRIILDHFFVPDHLHVAELHETLRGAVHEISGRIQNDLFRPALAQLGFSAAILHSQEYRELVDRVCALAVGDAVAVEWDKLLTEENYGRRQKLTNLSEERVLLMMKQIAIERIDHWLKDKFPSWSRLLRAGTRKRGSKESSKKRVATEERRQQVVDMVAADIPVLITGCVQQLMDDIRGRVRNQLTQLFDHRFMPPPPGRGRGQRRSSIFESALRSFLTQAREYEGKKQPQLRTQADELQRRLLRWQQRAQRQVDIMRRCTAVGMGEELLSSIQRQWDDAVAMIGDDKEDGDEQQPTLSEELRNIITATHGHGPVNANRRSKIPHKASPVTASELDGRWKQAQTARVVSDLDAEVLDINAQLYKSGEKLGIDTRHCPPASFITKGKLLDSTGMLRAVALAWMFGTDVKPLKDGAETAWEQVEEVVSFLYAKCRHVLLRRLMDSGEPSRFAEQMSSFYHCASPRALAARLKDRTLPPSPYLLQLLATAIRCNLVMWDRANIADDQPVQLLSPNFHLSAASKALVPYLHLVFLPCKLQHEGGSRSSPAAVHPFLVVPAFRTQKSVRMTSMVAVRRYEVEEGAALHRVPSPTSSRSAVDIRHAFTPAVHIPTSTRRRPPSPAPQPQAKRAKRYTVEYDGDDGGSVCHGGPSRRNT
jgi:hypothetical protein